MKELAICFFIALVIGFAIGWATCAVMTAKKIDDVKEEKRDGKIYRSDRP